MAKKIEWGSNELFKEKYLELKSAQKVGEYYGCSKTTVLNHARKIGFDVNSIPRDYKLSLQDKQKILEQYKLKTSTELAKEYNVSRGMITKIWYDADLKGKEVTRTQKHDLTNQRFTRLIALSPTAERDASGNVMWLCQCDCGQQKTVSAYALISEKIKSCGCLSKECLKQGQGLNFKDLTGQIFGKLTVLNREENYITRENQKQLVQWKCKCQCGRETSVLSSNLLSGNTQSCGLCKENSHGNIKIETLLKENNIIFEREKRFEDCKDKSYLPFDFFVENKYLIEFDGKQHFEKNSLFNYEITHKHDLIKNDWCKQNNIPLIRIPYTHYDQLTIEDLKLESSSFIINNADT